MKKLEIEYNELKTEYENLIEVDYKDPGSTEYVPPKEEFANLTPNEPER